MSHSNGSAVPHRASANFAGDAQTSARAARIFADHSHCGRHVTGLERITRELFSSEALKPLAVTEVRSKGGLGMIAAQTFGLAGRALTNPRSLILCPGFPPSPLLLAFGSRVLPYIHDLFLITRWQDLNPRAKLYMALPFRLAVMRLRNFLVNSEYTAGELRKFARADAAITLYRPKVRNVFEITSAGRVTRAAAPGKLRLVALGTVEPRKNLIAAARITGALRNAGFPEATLDIAGRFGWGPDAQALQGMPGVTLRGYLPAAEAAALLDGADILISTSHDEGLGLPLIEAQYAGLAVAAPDKPVFREVLGASGLLLNVENERDAASRIAAMAGVPGWRLRAADAGAANITRWNALAEADRANVIALIETLSRRS